MVEFCIYCNEMLPHYNWPCEHCKIFPINHEEKPCHSFVVNLDDEWGMARRSDKWKEAEFALRKVVCEEYGHKFFPGPPWTWKTYCARCSKVKEKDNG